MTLQNLKSLEFNFVSCNFNSDLGKNKVLKDRYPATIAAKSDMNHSGELKPKIQTP